MGNVKLYLDGVLQVEGDTFYYQTDTLRSYLSTNNLTLKDIDGFTNVIATNNGYNRSTLFNIGLRGSAIQQDENGDWSAIYSVNNSTRFWGTIAYLRFWDKELTQGDVTKLYQNRETESIMYITPSDTNSDYENTVQLQIGTLVQLQI